MKKKLLASVLSLMLITVQSQATIKATATRTNPDHFTDGSPHLIPLNNAGATAIAFTTTKPNQKVIISYSAECAVKGGDNATYLDIDILVDGRAAPPSNSDNAFCTDHGNNILGNWVSAVTLVVALVRTPGAHSVQVQGTLQTFNSGDEWIVDDSATIVTN
jgi:hypothetical protein